VEKSGKPPFSRYGIKTSPGFNFSGKMTINYPRRVADEKDCPVLYRP
jgi:hypothetical protein